MLSPSFRHLEVEVRRLGIPVTVLDDAPSSTEAPIDPPFMATPGLVLFTSGSTGVPRPVYRTTAVVLEGVRAALASLGASGGGGVVTTLPLARAFGFNQGLMAAVVLDAPLALLRQFDHGALLRLFATGEYQYWPGTPVMADVLGRCPLSEAPRAPRLCIAGGRVPAPVGRRFTERFGVPLRQLYGTTETGTISVDASSSADVRTETSGRPLPGVALRVGETPHRPVATGTLGRIWFSGPRHMMEGYGFPPDIEPPATVDGWWGLPDVGHVDETGRVTVAGRLDDCFRTDAGHVVSPAAVAQALEDYPDVTDVAAVPVTTPGGRALLGVLVQSSARLDLDTVRAHLWRALPRWSQPRLIEATDALPRLPNGRVDRKACIARLETSLAADARP